MRTVFALLSLVSVFASGAASAQAYPSKPVTLVVPYPAGGSNDLFARMIGKHLSDELKQPFIIDNRPGASGNTGTGQVAKSPPDGYTLAVVSSSMTTNAAVHSKLPFDAMKSFAPVAMFAKGPFIVAVSNEFPPKTPQQLMSLLKTNPDKFNYASSGNGSSNQFATELLKSMSGIAVVHVPYKGMAPAVTDLMSGQTQLLIASGPSLLSQVRAGRIRAIGITSTTASPIAPELAPMAEAVPGYDFELWWGMLAPSGTPPEIVQKLNTAVNKILQSAEVKALLLKEGAVANPISSAAFADTIASDIVRWQKLAKQQNISAE